MFTHVHQHYKFCLLVSWEIDIIKCNVINSLTSIYQEKCDECAENRKAHKSLG